jgi:alkylation response protein AidB-like acyl-CoA dehydrogenase
VKNMAMLTEEQLMIRDMVREFATDELAPHAAAVDARRDLAPGVLPKLAALNLLGLRARAEHGGAGVDTLTYAVALEEVARACASTAVVLLAHNSLGVAALEIAGTDAQRHQWLESLARGETLAGFALSEPEAGSDSAAMRTLATRSGDGWELRGNKSFVVNAPGAGVFLVAARSDPAALAPHGIDVFLVGRDAPGLVVRPPVETLGWRGAAICGVEFDGVHVADSARLGAPGAGLELCETLLDGARIGLAAIAVGIAQGAFERALRYAHDRPQFGRPIAEHQSIQSRLAESATELHAARATVRSVCRRADRGEPFRKHAAMAKLLASEVASRVCDHALQVHGGYGYIVEYQVERSYRDAKLCEIAYGTNEVLRLLIASEWVRDAQSGADLS